jgi:hypothetical protein
MDIKLVKGNTYLFHDKERNIKFTANFIEISIRSDGYKTLLVEKYISDSSLIPMNGTLSMPFSWIEKVELVNINNINTNNISYNDIILENL